MTNFRGTPGPWTYANDMGCPMVWAGNMRICDVRGWGHLTGVGALNLPEKTAAEIQDANGRLITAAPDLLEALKVLYDETKSYIEVNHLGDPHHNQSMKLARAAIAKATATAGAEA